MNPIQLSFPFAHLFEVPETVEVEAENPATEEESD